MQHPYPTSPVQLLTSKVSDKVFQHHLPVRLDVGAVHVGVEKNDGKGQDEDGVWVVELLHHLGVTHAVALAVGVWGRTVSSQTPALEGSGDLEITGCPSLSTHFPHVLIKMGWLW